MKGGGGLRTVHEPMPFTTKSRFFWVAHVDNVAQSRRTIGMTNAQQSLKIITSCIHFLHTLRVYIQWAYFYMKLQRQTITSSLVRSPSSRNTLHQRKNLVSSRASDLRGVFLDSDRRYHIVFGNNDSPLTYRRIQVRLQSVQERLTSCH